MDSGNTARTSARKRGEGSHHRRGNQRRRRRVDARRRGKPARSSGRCAARTSLSEESSRSTGWREVRDFLGRPVVARGRSRPRPVFPADGAGTLRVFPEMRVVGPVRLRGLRIINDLQMAPLTLPGMGVGKNTFLYTDQSPGDASRVRLTHQWVERSASGRRRRHNDRSSRPTEARPTGPISPSSGPPPSIPMATRSPTTISSYPTRPI